jgi:hypothetical protein
VLGAATPSQPASVPATVVMSTTSPSWLDSGACGVRPVVVVQRAVRGRQVLGVVLEDPSARREVRDLAAALGIEGLAQRSRVADASLAVAGEHVGALDVLEGRK